jgi:glutamyl-tRNA(Gln) amidotransferase subunit D
MTKKKKSKVKKTVKQNRSTAITNYNKKIIDQLSTLGIKTGDSVEITKKNLKFKGNILPQTELGDPNVLIIKQDNGYNVGISYDDSVEISPTGEKISLDKFPSIKQKQNTKLPEISLLATGGTIASRLDYITGGVVMASSPSEIFVSLPELYDEVQFRNIHSLFQMGSEDIAYKQWKSMAEASAKEINEGSRGVVIMHGTDMMGYSAAALSFMLPNLSAPVVFTGGQRSSDRGSFDGALNLISASRIAANANMAHVMVSMHESTSDNTCLLSPGTNVRKMHTSRRDAFQTINAVPIAKINYSGAIQEISKDIKRRSKDEILPMTNYEEKVTMVKIFPGSDPEIIEWYIDRGYKGIIIEGTGLGHVPTFPPKEETGRSWIPAIERAVESEVFVGMTSQCLNGRVHPFVYRALRTTFQKGVVYLEDMLPETSLVKLGWVLGNYDSLEEVKEKMSSNLVGEISSRSQFSEVF